MHYLDNAATTRVHPDVLTKIDDVMREIWANPSSLYAPGFAAETCIDEARNTVAKALGAAVPVTKRTPEVVFTASGTEASNIAIFGAARARVGWGRHIVLTGYEHPCVENVVKYLCGREGFTATVVKPGVDGRVPVDAIVRAVRADTVLVCAMQVNNETGAVIDVAALAGQVKRANKRTAVHVDAVQGFAKLPLRLAETQIDTCAVSGHKLHAPKGVGALYVRRGFSLLSPLCGGSQEGGLRPGTENTPYIAGFAKAAQLAIQNVDETRKNVEGLSQRLRDGLAEMEDVVVHSPSDAWAGILMFSCLGLKSEVILHFLEEREIYISSGSACSKGGKSHTLTAMGLDAAALDSAVRVSFCADSTEEDVDALLAALREAQATLAKGRPVRGRGV